MATDPPAMHALLEQLDQDLEAGKSYSDQAAQDQFFQQLITNTQLQNRSKSGQGGLHTPKSLLEVVRYTLRGNKKAQYGPGGSDKKESQDALNHFFTIGSVMLKETYLAKLRGLVQKGAEGTARPATSSVRRSNAVKTLAPTHESTQRNEAEHDSVSRAMETIPSADHQILLPNNAAARQTYEPAPPQSKSQTINNSGRISNKRKVHDLEDDRNGKRIKTGHASSNTVILRIRDKRLLKTIESPGLPTKMPRTDHPPRFPYGLPTPSLSPPPTPPVTQTIIYHQPLIGCISQAEILEDIKSITMAITDFLETPQLYTASSPILATRLGNGTYFPSSLHLSCSPASHDSVWEWLIENIFQPDLPTASPFLGVLGDASVRRAVETTEGLRVLSAGAIVRELALAQLRDPEFMAGDQSGHEDVWGKVRQMAWRLKGKMSVSGEKFAIVRDRENRCTGVALKEEVKQEVKQEVKYVRDDGLERFRCL